MRRRSFVCLAAATAGAAAATMRSAAASGIAVTGGADAVPQEPALQEPALEEKPSTPEGQPPANDFNVGAFSISLAVKDLAASQAFYEQLGFRSFGGNAKQRWVILRNGQHVIGLFQGFFEKNILTFNPGWDQNAKPLDSFADIRELQRQLKAAGVKFATEADEKTTGPASFMLIDPDGNPVLFDQHV